MRPLKASLLSLPLLFSAPALASSPVNPLPVWKSQDFVCERVRAEMEAENLSNIAPVNREEVIDAANYLEEDLRELATAPCAGPDGALAGELLSAVIAKAPVLAKGINASAAYTCSADQDVPRRAGEIESGVQTAKNLRRELSGFLVELSTLAPPTGPIPHKDGVLDLFAYAQNRSWPESCGGDLNRGNFSFALDSANRLGCKLQILEHRMAAVGKRLASGAPNEVEDGPCRSTHNADGSLKPFRGLSEFKDGFGTSDVTGLDGI